MPKRDADDMNIIVPDDNVTRFYFTHRFSARERNRIRGQNSNIVSFDRAVSFGNRDCSTRHGVV